MPPVLSRVSSNVIKSAQGQSATDSILESARSSRVALSGARPRGVAGIWRGFRTLLPFARYARGQFLAAAALSLVGTGAMLVPYWAVYDALRAIMESAPHGDRILLRDAGIAASGVIGMAVLLGASTYLAHRAAFATLEHLRLRIGQRLGEVPLGFLTQRRSGSIQRALNDDVERLESFLSHAIPDLVSAGGVLLFTTVWLFCVDLRMGLAALSVVLIALPMMSYGTSLGAERTEAYGRAMAHMNGSIVEFVRGLPVVRMFHQGESVFSETAQAIEDATTFQAEWGRQLVPIYTAFYTLLASNVVVILPVALWLWTRGELQTADLLFFLVLGLGYTTSVMKLMQLTTQFGRLAVGAAAVAELDEAPIMQWSSTPVVLGVPSVELSDVHFSHRDLTGRLTTAVAGASFIARPGTITALVGPSGAGKSTVAKLVCRFWDVERGSVRVAGIDVRDLPAGQLMTQVAFVLQETFLFDDTIEANLRLARPDATVLQLEAAAKGARAHDFITALPEGYGTRLGERGARLSGGERQRLSIARALLRDAPIVVLDEATAFVDPENEVALQEAIGALSRGRTVIVIAHRLSTIAGADQILVMDHGRIVERGRHHELLALHGLYARLWAAFDPAEAS
jgi:ATP-binding cassette, subfamily B, bacterial IrtA/YbtP